MHVIAEEGCLSTWYIGVAPPPPRNREVVGRGGGGVIGNWNWNWKQFACAQIGVLRPHKIACISQNGGCGARWCKIGAFWGVVSTHSALGEIPVRGGWRNWHARKSALRPHKIARLWCAVVRNRGFLGGDFHSLRTGGNSSARGLAVCDRNQYQYGIVISHYTHPPVPPPPTTKSPVTVRAALQRRKKAAGNGAGWGSPITNAPMRLCT